MKNNLAFTEVQNGFQHTMELFSIFILSNIDFTEETGFLN